MQKKDRRGIATFFTIAFFCACLTAAVPGNGWAEDTSEDFSVKMLCRGPETLALHMRFIGSNPDPEVIHLMERIGPFNPAFGTGPGNDPLQWQAGARSTRRIIYQDIYPGIDLVSYSNQGKMQYDLVIDPWAEVRRIKIAYEGIEKYVVQGSFSGYQVIGGVRHTVPVSIHKTGNFYELTAHHYDRATELVIPTTSVPLSTEAPTVALLK